LTKREDSYRLPPREVLVKREDSYSPVRLPPKDLLTKTKRRTYPTIFEPGRETVDLTGDTDSEDESNGTCPLSLTDQGCEGHVAEEDLEDDYWWPDSGEINPNIDGSDP
jgi:hypothetical protein